MGMMTVYPVSYTHLDVYKRQDDKHPREYNRIVPFQYFNQENKEIIYALGPVEEREAVLIFNEKTKTVPEEVIEYFI